MTLASEDANLKLVEVVTVADADAEDHVGNSLLIWELTCSKSEQKFSLLTKPQGWNLQQIVANMILIKNSYNINKFWVGIFTRQGDINQVY